MTRFQLFILALILGFAAFSLILFALSPDYVLDLSTIRLGVSVFTAIILVASAFRYRKRSTGN
jgi:hypothetical protein